MSEVCRYAGDDHERARSDLPVAGSYVAEGAVACWEERQQHIPAIATITLDIFEFTTYESIITKKVSNIVSEFL